LTEEPPPWLSPERTAWAAAVTPWLMSLAALHLLRPAGGPPAVEAGGQRGRGAPPPIVPMVDEPPVAPKPGRAPSEKLDLTLSAREAARGAAASGGGACRAGDTAEAGGDTGRAGLAERAEAIGGEAPAGRSTATDAAAPTGQRRSPPFAASLPRRPRRAMPPPDGKAGADCCARAELRAAGDEAVGDAGAEDAEAEKRKRGQHDRHGVVDGRRRAAETGRELREQRRADADDDGEHQHLDAGVLISTQK
jgi:hypothetical protein